MNKAIEAAKEIERKQKALQKTKSDKLKSDYGKSIRRSMNELRYYCRCKGISYSEVIKAARC